MKQELFALADAVRQALLPLFLQPRRSVADTRGGGDPHFEVDEIAERVVAETLALWKLPIAYCSEDRGMVCLSSRPQNLLIIDPIDGTRPAMVGFESCCFSVAVAPFSETPRMRDITHALVTELKTGTYFYAEAELERIECSSPELPRLSSNTDLERMFWSIELTAHPVRRLVGAYGHLIDGSVTGGAVFVFTSASYSITRLITGQLDCHVDIGHRLLMDNPGTLLDEFLSVGLGKVACLFPYDIAAAVFIASKAGATITDAYGHRLDDVLLVTEKRIDQQLSLIAASTSALHRLVLDSMIWPPSKGSVA
jgi:myo-inositol-1(or 4)-monophosphatase